jgi:hypothetical protein
MTTSKRTVAEFLIFKFGPMPKGEKRALFNREAATLFKEYRNWYKDNNWGKNPSGVKLLLFKKWLVENNCFFVTKNK